MNLQRPWTLLTISELEERLSTNHKKGLSEEEVQKRQKKYGKNTFSKEGERYLVTIAKKQLQNPLVIILFFAGTVTFFLGAFVDTIVIAIALCINVSIDIFQRGRASRAFVKLRDSQKKYAFLLREGKKEKVLAEELVPGDIVLLEAGHAVPADARLVLATSLHVNEAILTGEWVDVEKDTRIGKETQVISEQSNMVWMGTLISTGRGVGIVVETGKHTQLGLIAESLKEVGDEDTPLQHDIRRLSHFITAVILFAISIITAIGLLGGNPLGQMLLIAVAVAVAAIPEGLPAAVTVVLALGMERILNKRGLVRNLLAAETLGSTTVILTDKTGTLTEAKMAIREIATFCHIEERRQDNGKEESLTLFDEDERAILKMAVLASDAFVGKKEKENELPHVEGRPVERAIVTAGLLSGMNKNALIKVSPQVRFIPFSSTRALSLSVHQKEGEKHAELIIVGAPEKVLGYSHKVLVEGKIVSLDKEKREKLATFQEQIGEEGARLVAVGFKEIQEKEISQESLEKKTEGTMIFGGFIVLDDPVRADVAESIRLAQNAHIRILMVTGDHGATALRIAREVGIAKEKERVLTGKEIETLSDKELIQELKVVNVYARVLPQQKLRITQLLKGQGEVVAMTGDGVNDAPALRSADIGVSLQSGTDVAKEASDLILLDNGFSIIVYAVEEGRRIITNLKKITAYLLSTGFSEIALVGGALVVSGPLPLLPAQILWVNIVSEGFMNFAFAFEPHEKGSMSRDPRETKSTILTPQLRNLIFVIGIVSGVLLIALYFLLMHLSFPIEEVRTMLFVALSISSILFSFSLKDTHNPLWKISLFSNKYLLGALAMSLLFLLGALLLPPLQNLLSLTPLSPTLFVSMIFFGFFNLCLIEVSKYLIFRKR